MDIQAQIECVKREISLRKQFYPKWIAQGKKTQENADYEILAMEAVLQTLQDCQKLPNKSNSSYRLYQDFVDHYFKWHEEVNKIKPRYDSRQGKALNDIITYLIKESNEKSEEGAFKSFKFILSKWETLNEFIRGQPSLIQINQNLIEIITKIRLANGNKLGSSQQEALARLQQRAAESGNTATN